MDPDDVSCLNSPERLGPDAPPRPVDDRRRTLNVGTWNLRTLADNGKLGRRESEKTGD